MLINIHKHRMDRSGTVGRPFFEGYKFCELSKKEVRGNYFCNMTLGAPFYNTHELTRDGVFGETNFMEVPKIYEIRKIYGP